MSKMCNKGTKENNQFLPLLKQNNIEFYLFSNFIMAVSMTHFPF